jgi:hypothetical protein
LIVHLIPLIDGGINGQDKARLPSQRDEANQHQGKTSKLMREILDDINRRKAREDQFIANLLTEGPQQQVKLWNKKRTSALGPRIRELLVVRGVDAAPYLAGMVRNGKGESRIDALELLCDMDRFVPAEGLLFPELGRGSFRGIIDTRGEVNRIQSVTGRRIGEVAYSAVRWAAEQTEDRDLYFHASLCMGLLDEKLRGLSIEELIRQWRDGVIKSKGALQVDFDASLLSFHLADVLIERAPESLPPLIAVLQHDSDQYVKEAAIGIVSGIDAHRFRLRASEIGQRTIEAVRQALERGNLKPLYAKPRDRENYWKQISAQVFDDKRSLEGRWSFYAFALERLYGAKTTKPSKRAYALLPEPNEEMRRFYTYLTDVDPFFPSWEYMYFGSEIAEPFHPRFRRKMERYYEQWRRFRGEEG